MKKQRQVPFIECDGCQYDIPHRQEPYMLTVSLLVPRDDTAEGFAREEFHFHGPFQLDKVGPLEGGGRDCFRFWLDPHSQKRSLKERGYDDATIDEFLAHVSFRPLAHA